MITRSNLSAWASRRAIWRLVVLAIAAAVLVGLAEHNVAQGLLQATITRITKQDTFVLINHGKIPTVSFGPCRAHAPGAHHMPDEFLEIENLWTATNIAYEGVRRWMES